MSGLITSLVTGAMVLVLSACSPSVGSEGWCEDMINKAQGEWSPKDALSFSADCDANIKPDSDVDADWCEEIMDTPGQEWSMQDSRNYSKHC